MGNISRKSRKKLIQKMKATYHEIQLIKIMYTEEALPRYKVPTKLYYRNDGRDITTVASLVAWWKNNSFTQEALAADVEYERQRKLNGK